jgi:branched-chain amino acid transport system ATP-binding protein/neutral amino acid transport system ATP-binding protein
MTLLSAKGIAGGYSPTVQIVKGIDISLDAGKILTIIGPNGAGKSTFLKLLCGALKPVAGEIWIDGKRVGSGPNQLANHGVVFVPQEDNIFPSLSVDENLSMGCYRNPKLFRARRADVVRRIPLLDSKRRATARSLSGGQRQLLAMGVALMAAPRILALDEPTAGLSPIAAADLFSLVTTLASGGVAIAMVEQNALEALRIADQAAVFVNGTKVREGAAAEIAGDPEVRRLFLGTRSTQ